MAHVKTIKFWGMEFVERKIVIPKSVDYLLKDLLEEQGVDINHLMTDLIIEGASDYFNSELMFPKQHI